MSRSTKVYLEDIDEGYCFPQIQTFISKELLENYMRIMESSRRLSRTGAIIVPPGAIASFTIGKLLSTIQLPPGSVHTSEEIISASELEIEEKVNIEVVMKNKSVKSDYILVSLRFNITKLDTGNSVLEATTVLVIPKGSN
ncbi:MAG: hypothetical protein ACJ0OL_02040 [Dehalococcoidia bacterium]